MRSQTPSELAGWIPAAVLGLVIAATLADAVFSSQGLLWDFVSYYNAGARLFHAEGGNLYRTATPIAGQPPFSRTFFDYIGLPLSAWLLAPLGAFAPEQALRIFKLFCAVCAGLGLWLLWRGVLGTSDPRWRSATGAALFLGAVAAYGPFWLMFAVGGQLTAAAFLALVASFVALRRDRLWLSALCFSAAILLKPLLAPSLWVFAVAREWRWLGRLAAVLAGEAALSLALFGLQVHADWFALLRQKEGIWATPWWNNVSVLALAGDFWYYRAGQLLALEAPPPPALYGIQWAYKLAVLALFAWLVIATQRSALRPEALREHTFALAVLLPLLLATTAWPHYLVIFLLPLAIAAGRSAARSRGAALVCGVLLVSALRPDLWALFVRGPRLEPVESPLAAIALGLYGRGTLLLALVALLLYHARWLRLEAAAPARQP
jgi:hypothetical protein